MGSQVIQPDNPAIPPAKLGRPKVGGEGPKGRYDRRKNNGDARRFTQFGAKRWTQAKMAQELKPQ
jgi:hypothetical protein